ncbi:hypothetical protein EV207_101169 [Scopulibacillus darangshiensis]|uniref:Uncharacterized protein n=1 Tax=Scopulibacillus darangshiensis TaxID=442528 RepID=A0A4R2PDL2_9BACL|nr:hypothetical protein [Scopulibacillus darangshiensis]TCP32191.1 hypothetical protein EV207_101169 [Scopulibacillus darangshiensis]
MQSYGIIKNGDLLLSSRQLNGYKPVEYAEIPADFDQLTQYITQATPLDKGDVIFVGVEIHQLEITEGDEFGGELPI